MAAELIFDCRCELGEGPLWHPDLQRLFWFDIAGKTLHAGSLDADGTLSGHDEWRFDDAVSVAGIIRGREELLIAGAEGLMLFDITSGESRLHAGLEDDKPGNRSNDGRVHPSGTLWISTMGRQAEDGAGAIYAFREGRVTPLFEKLSIPNAICFTPDGGRGYFTDGPTGKIMTCAVDPKTGLPASEPEVFADTSDLPGVADGAVVDQAGYLWNARHGGACAIRFAPDGTVDSQIDVPVKNVTCPSLAGPNLDLLVLTSGAEGDDSPNAGGLFAVRVPVPGQREPAVAP